MYDRGFQQEINDDGLTNKQQNFGGRPDVKMVSKPWQSQNVVLKRTIGPQRERESQVGIKALRRKE